MTTFRALCAELADSVELLLEMRPLDAKPMAITEHRLIRARAALAAPEQGPTLDDVSELCDEFGFYLEGSYDNLESAEALWEIIHAVLQRWGRPAVEPVPVSERLPGPEDCDDQGRCWFGTPGSDVMDAYWVYRKAEHRRQWDTHWAPHWALPVPQEGAGG